jgi:gliding motility-associated-like protein
VLCYGASTGAINISVSGGTTPFTYLWSSSQTSEDISTIPAGVYTITVTDASNCKANATVTITQPTEIILSSTKIDIKCYGNSSGSIDLSVSGGTPAYTYAWSSGQNTQDINTVAAGSYTITVTDANACSKSTSITLSQPTQLQASINAVHALCNTGTGSATATVTGGTSPYTYLWSSGHNTSTAGSLVAGAYTLSIQDANSCTLTAPTTITQPTAITATNVVTNVNCNGQSNGAINISVTGGTPIYSYLWNNGATTEDLSSVAAGNYTLTITDANNCKQYVGVEITQPTTLMATISATNILCNGTSTGQANLTVSGGTPAYTYNWSNGSASQNLSGVSAGIYFATITDSHSCSTTSSVTLTQPGAITLTPSSTNSSCGQTNGTASVSASGGIPPYSFLWSNGQAGNSLTDLSSGTYTVTVSDANNCSKTASVNVNDDNAATVSISSSTNVSCFGGNNGTANATVTGGTPAYSYLWTNGNSTPNATNLQGGTHTITVTDANGCVSSASVTISEPADISINAVVTNINCNGSNNGSIAISASGGTPSYSYIWSNGVNSQNISSLSPGNYILTVQDANNCQKTYSGNITEPSAITISSTVENATCFDKSDGTIDLMATGGTLPYTYLWSNGLTTEDPTGLSAGNYSITLTDGNNCKAYSTIAVSQPLELNYSVSSNNVTCKGLSNGSINLTVSGGTAPYNYSWSNGTSAEDISNLQAGNYSVIISDANTCETNTSVVISEPDGLISTISGTDVNCFGNSNGSVNLTVSGGSQPYNYIWNNGVTSQDLFDIDGGSFEVTVTDNNGCISNASIIINEPDEIVVSYTTSNVSCYEGNDGSIDLTVYGGSNPYSFNWSHGSSNYDVNNLAFGVYTVTVTDQNMCDKIVSASISQPTRLAGVIIGYNIDCYGNKNGSADLNIVGGTPNYVFAWSNGVITEDQYGMSPGTYFVTVSDSKGCTVVDSVIITEPSAPLAVDIIKHSNIICYGATNGFAQASVTGGTEPYDIQWSLAGQNTASIENVSAGTYIISITDTNQCKTADTIIIAMADEIKWSYVSTPTSCKGNTDGSIQITATGTEKPYTYKWNTDPESTDSIVTNLAYGLYKVTIQDKYGCSDIDSISVLNADNTCLEIPSCFTPNNDGVNDGWEIKHVNLYPDIHVEIYNRWGILLFTSDGYAEQWDGKHNGNDLPMASYVYIVDLGDGSEIITGTVTIIR